MERIKCLDCGKLLNTICRNGVTIAVVAWSRVLRKQTDYGVDIIDEGYVCNECHKKESKKC